MNPSKSNEPRLRRSTSSKFHHSFVRAKLKLTNTKQSLEPTEITEAKARLKATKNVTTTLEPIVHSLYRTQHEHSRLINTLCDTLNDLTITGENDKFGIFLKNMGRVHQNLEEIDQMYLINMKDQFLDPLRDFNATQIKKCQATKVKLKTIKGQFDLKKSSETKLLKIQSEKAINLSKMHTAQSASTKKLNELLDIRSEFVSSVQTMETEKIKLLHSFSQYMDSFAAYAKMHSTNVTLQSKMMNVMPPKTDSAHRTPNGNGNDGLDSDTEQCFVNDFDETLSTLNDWGKASVVTKEGIFKKRGAVNKSFKKRFFKLYTNKKLSYFDLNEDGTGPNGMLKGHANLTDIVSIITKKKDLLEIQTKTRKWMFKFADTSLRDEWYGVFHSNCVQQTVITMKQTAQDFGEMFIANHGGTTMDVNNDQPLMHTSLMQSASATNEVTMAEIADMIPTNNINMFETDGNGNESGMKQLAFSYPTRVKNCTILNDGRVIQINIDIIQNKCVLFYENNAYFLHCFKFHTPAEHMIDGRRYEMECHLVHTNEFGDTVVLGFIFSVNGSYTKPKLHGHVSNKSSKLSYHLMAPKKGKRKKGKSALNVPEFTDDDEESDGETDTEDFEPKYDLNRQNAFFAQFWDELPLRETSDVSLSKALRFDYLWENAGKNFTKNIETNEVNIDLDLMEYTGSLTTPPYTEGVRWVISKGVNFIGLKQLNKLSLCWGQL